MSSRSLMIRLAASLPPHSPARVRVLRTLLAEEGAEEDSSGSGGGVSGSFLEFMEEVGDNRVTNPDTGNNVKVKSLKGPKGKKLVQEEFQRRLEKRKDKGEDKGEGELPTDSERMAQEDKWEDEFTEMPSDEVIEEIARNRLLHANQATRGPFKQRKKVLMPSTGKKTTLLALSRSKKPEDKKAFEEALEAWKEKAEKEHLPVVIEEVKSGFEYRMNAEKEDRERREGQNWRGRMRKPSRHAVHAFKSQLGGSAFDPWGQFDRDPDLLRIMKEGKKFSPEDMVKKPMAPGECHWNTSKLFQKGEVDQIVIGYAKQGDEWHQHTWGMKDGKVVETTSGNFGNDELFGLPLEGEEAEMFASWCENNPPGNGAVRMIR